jgi:periplasmic mercuric ion binding protein
MKILSFSAVLLFSVLYSSFSFAQAAVKKETIKVWGNCGMCKKTIEKAAKSAGASTASWNEDSKQLKVTYPAAATSGKKIQQAIAKAGYDTQDFTASDTAYNNLHGCCQYDRKEAVAAGAQCCDNTNCKKEAAACKDMACCKEKTCCKM